MTRVRKRRWMLAGAALLLAAMAAGLYQWWQARLDARVDLNRKLLGRWTGKARVPDRPEYAFGPGQDFSVLARIQPIDAPRNSFGVMSIVEKRKVGGITTAQGFSLHLEYGRLACQISPGRGFQFTPRDLLAPRTWIAIWQNRNAPAPVSRFVSIGPNLSDGRFHLVALTVRRDRTDGGRLYVDGRVVLTFDPTRLRGNLANTEPLLIGAHPDPMLSCSFNGIIEETRLYSRALSPAEVKAAGEMTEQGRPVGR